MQGKLNTPEKIRQLQRKLYQKAKQEKRYRFYALYDKVYRMDILRHAYRLVKKKKTAPGIDGITITTIEGMEGGEERYLGKIGVELKEKTYKAEPVRRAYISKGNDKKRPLGIPTIKDRIVQMATKIVIEPIFEADFQENSYGFRPKRNAHQAMDEIGKQLREGKTQVIDADITKYFDNISHDKLLKLIAKRIVDKNILRLIRMWLKAPIVEEGEDGKRRYKKNDKGTPQGGVISPLLANIYLNVLDRTWKIKRVKERFNARMIRYADDVIVMGKGKTERILCGIKRVLGHLELELNEEKTRIVEAREKPFRYLGFRIEMKESSRTGKKYPLIKPSKESIKHIKAEIKRLTNRKKHMLSTKETIKNLNGVVRGWTNYFYYGNCSRELCKLKEYINMRVRIYLRKKHKINNKGYQCFSYSYLYNELGLYKIPTNAAWKQAVKAYGRK